MVNKESFPADAIEPSRFGLPHSWRKKKRTELKKTCRWLQLDDAEYLDEINGFGRSHVQLPPRIIGLDCKKERIDGNVFSDDLARQDENRVDKTLGRGYVHGKYMDVLCSALIKNIQNSYHEPFKLKGCKESPTCGLNSVSRPSWTLQADPPTTARPASRPKLEPHRQGPPTRSRR